MIVGSSWVKYRVFFQWPWTVFKLPLTLIIIELISILCASYDHHFFKKELWSRHDLHIIMMKQLNIGINRKISAMVKCSTMGGKELNLMNYNWINKAYDLWWSVILINMLKCINLDIQVPLNNLQQKCSFTARTLLFFLNHLILDVNCRNTKNNKVIQNFG